MITFAQISELFDFDTKQRSFDVIDSYEQRRVGQNPRFLLSNAAPL